MTMNTPEDLFRDSISLYQELINNANVLSEQMAAMPAEEILSKCEQLQQLQKKQITTDSFLIEIMEDSGSAILDKPFVGEYQRILEKAMHSYDRVSAKAKTIKMLLNTEIQKLQKGQKSLAGYAAKSEYHPTSQGHY